MCGLPHIAHEETFTFYKLKGVKLVIMNRDDYEEECLSQLENTDFYEELQSDQILIIE